MPIDDAQLLTDRAYLTGVQYRSDANLAARQSVYAYQQPRIDLVATVLDLAGLTGQETIADIGCGNGIYLSELARRGHAGLLLGVDLSPGMLAAAHLRAPDAGLLVGDAAALPLADDVTDVSLAPHMLYHVPDRQAAARELRRITRSGGQLLVVLNGADHLAQLRDLVMAAAADAGWPPEEIASEYQSHQVTTLDAGAQLLAGTFKSVQRHDFAAELALPDVQPIADYAASMWSAQARAEPAAFGAAVAERVPFGPDGLFRVTTHSGLLICR
jgi:ubiquinone/menaquinone biosynthesis C-methylase UbiE